MITSPISLNSLTSIFTTELKTTALVKTSVPSLPIFNFGFRSLQAGFLQITSKNSELHLLL